MTDYAAAAQAEGFDLREVTHTKLPAKLPKLGHRSGRRPKLDLADYIVRDAPVVPPAVYRSNLEHDFPMYLNNELGDCGEAMTLHGIEAFHLDARTGVPPFADGDAEKLYEEVGGYVPGEPETDKGTDNGVLVEYWQTSGVACAADGSVHKIVASVFVEPKNVDLNQRAIWEFVALFRAIALPETAQGQKEWQVTEPKLEGPAAPGSWGGHDIPYFSYDGKRYRCATWGAELLLTYEFDVDYAIEGFVVVTKEMLDQEGVSPAGIDWSALTSDIKSLAG
jgi:hypothetical protein